MVDIGSVIKNYCKQNGHSIPVLAKQLNLSPSTLYASLNTNQISIERLSLISDTAQPQLLHPFHRKHRRHRRKAAAFNHRKQRISRQSSRFTKGSNLFTGDQCPSQSPPPTLSQILLYVTIASPGFLPAAEFLLFTSIT